MTANRNIHPETRNPPPDSPHALDYQSPNDEARYARLLKPDRSVYVNAVILIGIILSGGSLLFLALIFWLLLVRLAFKG